LQGFKENTAIEFIGEVNATYRNTIEQSPIGALVVFRNPVPHKELLNIYGTTSALLMNLEGYQHTEGLLPGKLFEYLATGLPILGFGPSVGDAAAVLQNAGSGMMFEKNNIKGAKEFLEKSFQAWQASDARLPIKNIAAYSRKTLTENLTALLK
jgi:glycosyltransferase involved in cell wall biosynthesis